MNDLCPKCGGSGYHGKEEEFLCGACNGTGKKCSCGRTEGKKAIWEDDERACPVHGEKSKGKESLVIIGPKNVGKTTLAEFLGTSLGISVYSTDDEIGKSIEELGEDNFRKKETEAIKNAPKGHIIDTGGGAILRNAKELKALGKVLCLRKPSGRDKQYQAIADLTLEMK